MGKHRGKQSCEEKVTRTLTLLKEFVSYVSNDVKLDMMFSVYIWALRNCIASIELGKDIENIIT